MFEKDVNASEVTQNDSEDYSIGAIKSSLDPMYQSCSIPLQDRVQRELISARSQAQKVRQLKELDDLLNKNPEIVRILDLIEQFRF